MWEGGGNGGDVRDEVSMANANAFLGKPKPRPAPPPEADRISFMHALPEEDGEQYELQFPHEEQENEGDEDEQVDREMERMGGEGYSDQPVEGQRGDKEQVIEEEKAEKEEEEDDAAPPYEEDRVAEAEPEHHQEEEEDVNQLSAEEAPEAGEEVDDEVEINNDGGGDIVESDGDVGEVLLAEDQEEEDVREMAPQEEDDEEEKEAEQEVSTEEEEGEEEEVHSNDAAEKVRTAVVHTTAIRSSGDGEPDRVAVSVMKQTSRRRHASPPPPPMSEEPDEDEEEVEDENEDDGEAKRGPRHIEDESKDAAEEGERSQNEREEEEDAKREVERPTEQIQDGGDAGDERPEDGKEEEEDDGKDERRHRRRQRGSVVVRQATSTEVERSETAEQIEVRMNTDATRRLREARQEAQNRREMEKEQLLKQQRAQRRAEAEREQAEQQQKENEERQLREDVVRRAANLEKFEEELRALDRRAQRQSAAATTTSPFRHFSSSGGGGGGGARRGDGVGDDDSSTYGVSETTQSLVREQARQNVVAVHLPLPPPPQPSPSSSLSLLVPLAPFSTPPPPQPPHSTAMRKKDVTTKETASATLTKGTITKIGQVSRKTPASRGSGRTPRVVRGPPRTLSLKGKSAFGKKDVLRKTRRSSPTRDRRKMSPWSASQPGGTRMIGRDLNVKRNPVSLSKPVQPTTESETSKATRTGTARATTVAGHASRSSGTDNTSDGPTSQYTSTTRRRNGSGNDDRNTKKIPHTENCTDDGSSEDDALDDVKRKEAKLQQKKKEEKDEEYANDEGTEHKYRGIRTDEKDQEEDEEEEVDVDETAKRADEAEDGEEHEEETDADADADAMRQGVTKSKMLIGGVAAGRGSVKDDDDDDNDEEDEAEEEEDKRGEKSGKKGETIVNAKALDARRSRVLGKKTMGANNKRLVENHAGKVNVDTSKSRNIQQKKGPPLLRKSSQSASRCPGTRSTTKKAEAKIGRVGESAKTSKRSNDGGRDSVKDGDAEDRVGDEKKTVSKKSAGGNGSGGGGGTTKSGKKKKTTVTAAMKRQTKKREGEEKAANRTNVRTKGQRYEIGEEEDEDEDSDDRKKKKNVTKNKKDAVSGKEEGGNGGEEEGKTDAEEENERVSTASIMAEAASDSEDAGELSDDTVTTKREHAELDRKLRQLKEDGYEYHRSFKPKTASAEQKRQEIAYGMEYELRETQVANLKKGLSGMALVMSFGSSLLGKKAALVQPEIDERKLRVACSHYEKDQSIIGRLTRAAKSPALDLFASTIEPWSHEMAKNQLTLLTESIAKRSYYRERLEKDRKKRKAFVPPLPKFDATATKSKSKSETKVSSSSSSSSKPKSKTHPRKGDVEKKKPRTRGSGGSGSGSGSGSGVRNANVEKDVEVNEEDEDVENPEEEEEEEDGEESVEEEEVEDDEEGKRGAETKASRSKRGVSSNGDRQTRSGKTTPGMSQRGMSQRGMFQRVAKASTSMNKKPLVASEQKIGRNPVSARVPPHNSFHGNRAAQTVKNHRNNENDREDEEEEEEDGEDNDDDDEESEGDEEKEEDDEEDEDIEVERKFVSAPTKSVNVGRVKKAERLEDKRNASRDTRRVSDTFSTAEATVSDMDKRNQARLAHAEDSKRSGMSGSTNVLGGRPSANDMGAGHSRHEAGPGARSNAVPSRQYAAPTTHAAGATPPSSMPTTPSFASSQSPMTPMTPEQFLRSKLGQLPPRVRWPTRVRT
jgi:hypothetical protein